MIPINAPRVADIEILYFECSFANDEVVCKHDAPGGGSESVRAAQRTHEHYTHVIGAIKIPNPLTQGAKNQQDNLGIGKITDDIAVRNVVAEETTCQGFETNPSYHDI